MKKNIAKINEIENRKLVEKNQQNLKSFFFDNINKIDMPLATLTKKN